MFPWRPEWPSFRLLSAEHSLQWSADQEVKSDSGKEEDEERDVYIVEIALYQVHGVESFCHEVNDCGGASGAEDIRYQEFPLWVSMRSGDNLGRHAH